MRNWKNWLLPLLTVLTVGALALLPLRLSTVEDGKLMGAVHAEALTADNNFPAKPPELPGRVRLLAQYASVPELLTIVEQEPEGEKREELSVQARAELQKLVELGVLPEKSNAYDADFFAALLYLRDQRDLSSAAFAMLDTYDKETGESLTLYLDQESGHILALELHSELLWDSSAPAEDTGRAFFDNLGLQYEPLDSVQQAIAVFRLADSQTIGWVRRYRDFLCISLEADWQTADDEVRVALGGPSASDAGVDAASMQIW